jgi:hypothetical protein
MNRVYIRYQPRSSVSLLIIALSWELIGAICSFKWLIANDLFVGEMMKLNVARYWRVARVSVRKKGLPLRHDLISRVAQSLTVRTGIPC